jgi:epoxyqueuosine reductase
MTPAKHLKVSSAILRKSAALGASLAGFAAVEDLKIAPSFTLAPRIAGIADDTENWNHVPGLEPGQVRWPDNARTVVVIAVEHPADKPEMDWWFGRMDPPGNRVLAKIINSLCDWIKATYAISAFHLPYHLEKGGTYLKDAAVLAGLGCIGKNNMLVTPAYGPRVRLRALTLDVDLPCTGPVAFDPCRDCDAPCRAACPRLAFGKQVYREQDYGQMRLPGRQGVYARHTCNLQMEEDIAVAQSQPVAGFDAPVSIIKYCRRCELACPL